MVIVLLASKKAHIWLLSCWHPKKPKYGCCLVGILKSPDMVVVMLADIFKSPDMVVVLLEFLK